MFYPNYCIYTLANGKSASFLKAAHSVHHVHSVVPVCVPSELATVNTGIPILLLKEEQDCFWHEKYVILGV